jgi:hypothetical protein
MDFTQWPKIYWPEKLEIVSQFLTDAEFAELLGRLVLLLAG